MAQAVDLAAIVLLAAAFPIALIVTWRDKVEEPILSPLDAVFISLLICHPFAVDRQYSAWRVLQWVAYMAVYDLAQAAPRRWIERAAGALLCGAFLVIGAEFLWSGARAGDWLQGNPNTAAAVVLQLCFLAAPNVLTWSIAGVALVATQCRGAFLAFVAALVVTRKPGQLAAGVTIIVMVVALALARPGTISNRMETWAEAWQLFLARPLVGWGPGCYTVVAQAEPGHPHADNFLLTVAAEQGLIGLLAWLWLIGWSGLAVIRSDDPARLGLVAWAVHNLVDATLFWYWPGIATIVALALTMKGAYGKDTDFGHHPGGGDASVHRHRCGPGGC